ncbi:MAG: hypothetical protein OEZ00_01090 [Dehalococcoidia bacterium]|nr:hypothetical protein [Dehalococcoidia bacterium]
MKTAAKVCFIALAVLLLATSLLACGGAEAPPAPLVPPAPLAPPPPEPAPAGNQPPAVISLTPEATVLIPEAVTKITCEASDTDGDTLTYAWSATGGTITGATKNVAVWEAPDFTGEFIVNVTVGDGRGGTAAESCTLTVQTKPPPPKPAPASNRPPAVISLTPKATLFLPEAVTRITCEASDPDGDTLTYAWSATGGTITGAIKNIAVWEAPDFAGKFVVNVTISDGRGGTAAKSCTLTVQTNQRPVISSVTAEPATLEREEISTITCLASDPDGDTLIYIWEATGGTITGTGNISTWKAPSVVGQFVISVSVGDGKGGTAESSCRIVVEIPEVTIVLSPLPDESGSIYHDGDIITSFRIGDNANNVGVRPYFSFDITELTGAEIKKAKVSFTLKETVNNPWFAPPSLYVEHVEYGTRALQPADFYLDGIQIEKFSSTPPTVVDIYPRLSRFSVPLAKPRFQVRLRLVTNNNLDSQEDYIEFTKAELTVTYIK